MRKEEIEGKPTTKNTKITKKSDIHEFLAPLVILVVNS